MAWAAPRTRCAIWAARWSRHATWCGRSCCPGTARCRATCWMWTTRNGSRRPGSRSRASSARPSAWSWSGSGWARRWRCTRRCPRSRARGRSWAGWCCCPRRSGPRRRSRGCPPRAATAISCRQRAGAGSCPMPTRCATSLCRATPSCQRARLIADLDAQEGPLQLPVYMAISASDAEVDPAAARDWLCRRASGPRRLIWYTPGPAPGTECGAVVERASASAGILDLSHIALPIAPDNPRYGAKGAYLDCSHYYWEADTPSWFICMDRTKTRGELGGAPGRDHGGQPATPRRAAADLQPGFRGHGRRPAGVPGRPGLRDEPGAEARQIRDASRRARPLRCGPWLSGRRFAKIGRR